MKKYIFVLHCVQVYSRITEHVCSRESSSFPAEIICSYFIRRKTWFHRKQLPVLPSPLPSLPPPFLIISHLRDHISLMDNSSQLSTVAKVSGCWNDLNSRWSEESHCCGSQHLSLIIHPSQRWREEEMKSKDNHRLPQTTCREIVSNLHQQQQQHTELHCCLCIKHNGVEFKSLFIDCTNNLAALYITFDIQHNIFFDFY